MKSLMFVLLGLVVGFLLCDFMSRNDISETITETVYLTDTVYVEKMDTIFITKADIRYEEKIIKDTVYMGANLPIRAFKTSKPFLYGNVSVEGEVVGEVLKMDIITDFKLLNSFYLRVYPRLRNNNSYKPLRCGVYVKHLLEVLCAALKAAKGG